jgi:hypothetical protein
VTAGFFKELTDEFEPSESESMVTLEQIAEVEF